MSGMFSTKEKKYTAVYSTAKGIDSLTKDDHGKLGYARGDTESRALVLVSDYLREASETEAYATVVLTEEFDAVAKRSGGAFPDNTSAILFYLRKNKDGLTKVSASISRLVDDSLF